MKKLLLVLALITGCCHAALAGVEGTPIRFVYKLHGQTRKYTYTFTAGENASVVLAWGIERNTRWQSGRFVMTGRAIEDGVSMSFLQPVDGDSVILPESETYAMVSRRALSALKDTGRFVYSGTEFVLKSSADSCVLHVCDADEGCEAWILNDDNWPLVTEMRNNPLGINWKAELPASVASQAMDVREELRRNPDKSGSIYYAYPEVTGSHTPAPRGYSPFYVSHYGRHGSRWISSDDRYSRVVDEFERNRDKLTLLGLDVYERLKVVWDDARGHGGELTPLGNRQLHDIAVRMSRSYPEIFSVQADVSARSSTKGRCIMSMAAFCDGLRERNPKLNITREASQRDMAFIAYETDESKAHGRADAYWYADFIAFQDSVQKPQRFMSALFADAGAVKDQRLLMEDLYWIAVDMQDVELDLSFYDLFTSDELFNIWQTINYRMYVRNGMSPEGRYTGPRSAMSLLDRIIDDADKAVAENTPAADLRFGHDTYLIRLLGLIGMPGCSACETDRTRYCDAWQDFRISPMAANFQMVFYRNSDGDVLVKVLHNEQEKLLDVPGETGPYYTWTGLRDYLMARRSVVCR